MFKFIGAALNPQVIDTRQDFYSLETELMTAEMQMLAMRIAEFLCHKDETNWFAEFVRFGRSLELLSLHGINLVPC